MIIGRLNVARSKLGRDGSEYNRSLRNDLRKSQNQLTRGMRSGFGGILNFVRNTRFCPIAG